MMMGEGLARLFECDPKNAAQMLDKAGEYAVARNQEIARKWYLTATGSVAAVFGILLLIGWLLRHAAFVQFVGEVPFYISLGSCAGALGAFFSILTRVGSTPLDPSAGRVLHWFEGAGRIVVGVLGAAFVQIAIKIGLALPMLAEKGYAGLFLAAFVAGASERLVPTLINRVELDDASKHETDERRRRVR